MSLYSSFKKLSHESLSIMIIPHSGKSVRQLKFKKILLYGFFSILTGLCICIIIFIYVVMGLNQKLDSKTQELTKLQTINLSQEIQIVELTNRTNQVNDKLSSLKELEVQVRNLVGLKPTDNNTSDKPVSRSAVRTDSSMEELDEDEEIDMEVLASNMDQEMENLNGLIDDVTGQLKILDATPNKMPTLGRITSKFGYRISPITGKKQFHKGLDIANTKNTKIYASASGIITFSGWNAGYGNTIIISHGYGYRTVYAHNTENLVKVGQKVNKGDFIAKMGSTGRSTGPHVHFEIHYNGKQIDPQKVLDH